MEIKIKIKNKERRGPDSEPKMRYFKLPLCRIFHCKSEIDQGWATRVSEILGQRNGIWQLLMQQNFVQNYVSN